MHLSDAPNMACIRLYPFNAPQPEPGCLLLHGISMLLKYGQRVRCIRLPPTVAMFLICGEAPAFNDNASKGKSLLIISSSATALFNAREPITTLLLCLSILFR